MGKRKEKSVESKNEKEMEKKLQNNVESDKQKEKEKQKNKPEDEKPQGNGEAVQGAQGGGEDGEFELEPIELPPFEIIVG